MVQELQCLNYTFKCMHVLACTTLLQIHSLFWLTEIVTIPPTQCYLFSVLDYGKGKSYNARKLLWSEDRARSKTYHYVERLLHASTFQLHWFGLKWKRASDFISLNMLYCIVIFIYIEMSTPKICCWPCSCWSALTRHDNREWPDGGHVTKRGCPTCNNLGEPHWYRAGGPCRPSPERHRSQADWRSKNTITKRIMFIISLPYIGQAKHRAKHTKNPHVQGARTKW